MGLLSNVKDERVILEKADAEWYIGIRAREALIKYLRSWLPFDKLRANGLNQCFPRNVFNCL